MSLETVEGFALSLQQRRLWRLHIGDRTAPAHCGLMLKGHLSVAKLKASAQSLIDRNEILRGKLELLPGMKFPILVVIEDGAPTWHEIDLSQKDPRVRAERLEELQRYEITRSFSLASGLLHLTLVTLSADEHLLLITLSSLCADSSTLRSFVRQLFTDYDADPDAIEAPPIIQYSQYAEWQRQLLESEEARLGREFWRNQRGRESSLPDVPAEKDEPNFRKFSPMGQKLSLRAENCARLAAIAESWGVSVNDFFLALWHTLIWRLSGRAETIAGRIFNGREHEALADIFGPISKCLPTVAHCSPSMPFSSVVRQLALSTPAMIGTSEYFDFDEYQFGGGQTLDAGGVGFFPFVFSFEEWPTRINARDLEIAIRSRYAGGEPFTVMLSVTHHEGSLLAEFFYDAARLSGERAGYVAGLFETLFCNAIEDPAARLSELEVLDQSDRRHLLPHFEAERTDVGRGSVIEEFEAEVGRRAEALAVVCGAEQLTYRELNERANQLGRYLLRSGVAREERVGVLLERSAAMIWAVLGVLKAGAAYVPLEVTNPQLRMQEVIADAGIGIVLSTEKWREILREARVKVICLDGAEGTAVASESVAPVAEKVAPENLAYVIYTSGSTGKPKGVMIQHGSLLNLGDALKRSIYDTLRSQSRVTLNAPLTFDASVKQWLQILNGHTLDILPEHVRYDAEALLAYARRNEIDVIDCTPAQLTSLIAAGLLDEGHRPFSAVLVGGDKLDAKTWQLLSQNKITRFYNVYGPTECTVDTTICLIEEGQSANSLGVPIANAGVYLLDESLRHVPVGVTGEIHIGGEGVSRGYIGQPALTAERFIPDPFAERPGARLYRSGDLARYSPPTLKFLGRKDQQVKIRGFRIELEEIEAVLRRSELVREAAVMMHEGAPGEKQLVAYAVLHDGRNPAADNPEGTLRQFLRERLPEFMIPAAFIIMDSFPLNRSGKLDRAALPKAPATSSPAMHYLAPRNANERLIAAIWREVLEVDRVGVDDNFFDLGGHSLLLTRAYGKLREAIPGNFSVIDLFRYPTVGSLAEFLTAGKDPGGIVTAANVQQRVDKQRAALAKQRPSMAGRRDH